MFLIILLGTMSGCGIGVGEISTTPVPSEKAASPTPDTEVQTPPPSPTPAAPVYNQYNVALEVNPQTRIVTGVQRVEFNNTTDVALEKIYFNTYLNAFSQGVMQKPYFSEHENKVFQNGKDYGYISVLNVLINKEDVHFESASTSMQVYLTQPLNVGEKIEMIILFEAYVPRINHRTGANDEAMWFGNFLPVLAVYDEYGWHNEPYYPAGDPFFSEISNYNVSVTTPLGYTVAGPGMENVSEADNKKITTFSAKLVRDFAFALSKQYEKTTIKTEMGVDINIYLYSNMNAAPFLELADKALEYYSATVGSYPYQQLTIVEVGLFISGGMEYPQVIFMDSDYLKSESAYRSLAHEIGHQWFYNIIGNNQIKEAWLDEGLAMLVQEGIFYEEESLRAKMIGDYNNLKNKLPDIENKGLLSDLSAYKTWSDYYNIQYTRGKLMMYSLRKKMGVEAFNDFLKVYYSEFAFKVVDRRAFVAAAEKAYGSSLADFFNSWMQDYDLPPLM